MILKYIATLQCLSNQNSKWSSADASAAINIAIFIIILMDAGLIGENAFELWVWISNGWMLKVWLLQGDGRTDDNLKAEKFHGLNMGAFYVSDTMCKTWDEFK